METTQTLLRPQALAARSSTRLGCVVLVAPTSTRVAVVGTCFIILAAAAVLYGCLVPTQSTVKGLLKAQSPGRELALDHNLAVSTFLVEAGQAVVVGDPLFQYCHIAEGAIPLTEPRCDSAPQVYISPFQGTIGNLVARPREAVAAGSVTLSWYPSNTVLIAELRVPEASLGEVKIGQKVRLQYDRYAASKHADVNAEVYDISPMPIDERFNPYQQSAAGSSYRVRVKLDNGRSMDSTGRQQLQREMGVTARIVTSEQRVYQWLWRKL